MRLVSWNINGIRTADVKQTLDQLNCDICCLQETKINRDTLTESIAIIDGYTSYFSYSRKRTGYSGVANYVTNCLTPTAAEEGLTGVLLENNYAGYDCEFIEQLKNSSVGHYSGDCDQILGQSELRELDAEGRVVVTLHEFIIENMTRKMAIINVYCPRVDPEKPDRLEYKLNFISVLESRVRALRKADIHVLIVGDFNISRHPIDSCRSDEDPDFKESPSRIWLNNLIDGVCAGEKMVDVFRQFHPDRQEAYTCWNTYIGARATNYGTRIDYILCDDAFFNLGKISTCNLMTEVQGSDHCPVFIDFDLDPVASGTLPALCTRLMPEFKGKQQSLKNFMVKRESTALRPAPYTTSERPSQNASKVKLKPQQSTLDQFMRAKHESAKVKSVTSIKSSPISTKSSENKVKKSDWTSVFKVNSAPKRVSPLCNGHKEPCVLRTVKKDGPNLNKQFYVCARPAGKSDDIRASCNHFEWVVDMKIGK